MRVKFHLANGSTVSVLALDRRGNETDNMADAVRRFREMVGTDMLFVTDQDMTARKAKEAQEATQATSVAPTGWDVAETAPEAIPEGTTGAVEVPDPNQHAVQRRKALTEV